MDPATLFNATAPDLARAEALFRQFYAAMLRYDAAMTPTVTRKVAMHLALRNDAIQAGAAA